MVQIIGPSAASQQAAQVGQQVGGGLAKAMGFMQTENMMQQAMNSGDPAQLAMAMAKMNIFAPETGRAMGPMYQAMLDRMGSKQLSKNLGEENYNAPGMGNNPDIENEISPKGLIAPSPDAPSNNELSREIVKTNPVDLNKSTNKNDVFAISQQYVEDLRPDLNTSSNRFTNIPTFDYEIKSDLRPEEEAQMRQQLESRGVLPKVQDQIIQRTREDIKTRFGEAKESWNLNKIAQDAINAKWKTFKDNAPARIGESFTGYGKRTQQDFMDKYFQYAQRLPVNMTPEEMHTNAWTQLRRDMNQFDALAEVTSMPYIRNEGTLNDYIKTIREAYEPLKEKGYIEALKEDAIDNKGMGMEEMHAALWGQDTSPKSMSLMAIDAPGKFVPNKGILGGYKVNENYEKDHKKYINTLSNNLKQISLTDDLVLLRAQVLDKNGTERDFTEALNMAQENGLKLSPFQESQLQEIRVPRTPPIWQFFDPFTWPKYLRLMRGKK